MCLQIEFRSTLHVPKTIGVRLSVGPKKTIYYTSSSSINRFIFVPLTALICSFDFLRMIVIYCLPVQSSVMRRSVL